MAERRWSSDICEIDASKIETRHDNIFGPVTIFKDVVIARAIVHEYDDGWAYKPGKELGEGYWTANGMWATSGGHPATAVISTRDEIHGRTVNVRFSKSLKDIKTGRPMNRGILADLEVFDNKVSPELLSDLKNGKKSDVSIGFFFDYDDTPGVVDDEEDQALKGTAYDYVQRNITINHIAFGIDSGRCSMPYCGIGADGVIREATGDPFGKWKTMTACIKEIMKENPDYTKEQAAATCATIEKKSKAKKKDAPKDGEEDFKPTDDDKLSMKVTIEEVKVYLKDVLGKLDSIEFVSDDLLEEEYQGNLTNMTASERAKRFHNINDDEWLALTEAEKEDYISKLPPEKPLEGTTNKDEGDDGDDDGECEGCDEDDYDEFMAPHLDEDAVMTLEQRKELPDSAYAYIEADCTEEDGETPQKCRHMSVHDEAHVRAAIAVLEDTENAPAYIDDAKAGICTASEKFKFIGVVACGSVKQKKDSVDEVARAKELLKDLP